MKQIIDKKILKIINPIKLFFILFAKTDNSYLVLIISFLFLKNILLTFDSSTKNIPLNKR